MTMRIASTLLLLSLILVSVSASAEPPRAAAPKAESRPIVAAGDPATAQRPAKWAQPLQATGLPNLHKVSKDLYRSAQPTAAGIQNLGPLGVKTVVNLRSFHSDASMMGKTAIKGEHIPMKAWHPEEEDVVRFLRIMNDPKRVPVLVHCQHGADRTGTMCAIYRITVQGWTKEEALREMKDGGFGFHEVWQDLVQYINGLDVDRIKKKAGIKSTPAS
jgi:protein tyrosine/serine phosphatase